MHRIKLYLILLTVLFGLALATLVWIANTFAPEGIGIVLLVYVLIGVIGFSFATIAGFYLRRMFGQRELLLSYAYTATRQGIWFSLILIISFLLLHLDWFTWVNALLLVITFVFLESFLLMKNQS